MAWVRPQISNFGLYSRITRPSSDLLIEEHAVRPATLVSPKQVLENGAGVEAAYVAEQRHGGESRRQEILVLRLMQFVSSENDPEQILLCRPVERTAYKRETADVSQR